MKRFFTDATWARNGVSYIGFCSRDLFVSETKSIKAKDCNHAELEGVMFCIEYVERTQGKEQVEILTDSQYVLDCNLQVPSNIKLLKIPRDDNDANTLVSNQKENNHVRSKK